MCSVYELIVNIYISNTSKINVIIRIIIVTCDKINTNAYAMIEFHLVASIVSNFCQSIAIIDVICTIIHTIETSAVICIIIDKLFLFIVFHDTTQQTLTRNAIVMLNYDTWDANTGKNARCYPFNNKYNYLSVTIIFSVIMIEAVALQTKMMQLLLTKQISGGTIVIKQMCDNGETEMKQLCNKSRTITRQYTTTTIINEMASAVDILTEISILLSFSHVLTIVFDKIALNLDKKHESECDHANDGNVTTIMNNFYKIRATSIVFGFFWDVLRFILQAIDTSSLNIALSIKFEAIGIAIDGLTLTAAVPPSTSTVSHHSQVVYNVCCIFLLLCVFFDFMMDVLLIHNEQ